YKSIEKSMDLASWIFEKGVITQAFPVKPKEDLVYPEFLIEGSLLEISEKFNKNVPHKSKFENTGIMIKRTVLSVKTYPDYIGKRKFLKDVLVRGEIPEEYYIKDADIPKWKYLKGAKHILRESKRTGKTFKYDEGAMVFPDRLDRPSRTIVTGEGGRSPSRFKHVIKVNGRLRRLVPIELEKLNMFPPGHTEGVSDTKRAFLMGNAIVVGVVERLGKVFVKVVNKKRAYSSKP
ncbi:MAG: DNA cytosine methyltransferase, partial [Candidatus Omnitrophica bacterium]|nr:DNA cytosine methyltransferase [Candidatus Omnitrophota bacterium]